MRQTFTAAQTKAQFAESLRLVEQGDIVVITRHGKPVAAMINVDELEQFERLRVAGPESGLGSLVCQWGDTDSFVALLEQATADRTRPRELPKLGD